MSRSKIRVALCTDGVFPHALGGMQRHSRLLAEHLARNTEIELTVLHPHETQVFDPALSIAEVRIDPIDANHLYLRELWHYSARVSETLSALAPDVVISQGFCVLKEIDRFRDRLIVHPHGLEMFQGLTLKDRLLGAPFRWLLKYAVRRAAVTISLGGKLTAILEKLASGSAGRVVTVPNAVELPVPTPAYPNVDGPLRVLFVGRFAFNKGIDVLLAVARKLVKDGHGDRFLFTLAGDGPERARMEEVGLPPNVHLVGRVDDERLNALYGECHALLLPTRFEGMPTVVLEAMARARPVIVSDVGASAELVSGRNGYLLPPGDAGALHTALMQLAALSNDERRALGASGAGIVAEKFTWPCVSGQFAALIRELAG